MDKYNVLRFRADERHQSKVKCMAEATGLSPSEVLRRLVENAQVVSMTRVEPVATLSLDVQEGEER